MPNQPKPGTHRHEISAIPDDLWAAVCAKAAAEGESVSEATRQLWVGYVAEDDVDDGGPPHTLTISVSDLGPVTE